MPWSAAASESASSKSATTAVTPSGSFAGSDGLRTIARTLVPRSARRVSRAEPVLPVAPVTRTGIVLVSIGIGSRRRRLGRGLEVPQPRGQRLVERALHAGEVGLD